MKSYVGKSDPHINRSGNNKSGKKVTIKGNKPRNK